MSIQKQTKTDPPPRLTTISHSLNYPNSPRFYKENKGASQISVCHSSVAIVGIVCDNNRWNSLEKKKKKKKGPSGITPHNIIEISCSLLCLLLCILRNLTPAANRKLRLSRLTWLQKCHMQEIEQKEKS